MKIILRIIFLFFTLPLSAQLTITPINNAPEVIWNKKQDVIAIKINFSQNDSALHNKIIFYDETQIINSTVLTDTFLIKNWKQYINGFAKLLIDEHDSIVPIDISTGRTIYPYLDAKKSRFEKLPPQGYSDVSSWNYKYKHLTTQDSCLNFYIDMRRYNLIKKGTYRLIIMYRCYSEEMGKTYFTCATEKLIQENNLSKKEIFNGLLKSNSLVIKVK